MTTLITGFPGFLATQLLPELLPLLPEDHDVELLVLPALRPQAQARLDALVHRHPELAGRCQLLEADITRERLGLTPQDHDALAQRVRQVWHLAAIYDLAVSSHMAYRVNVTGTIHMLQLCEQAAALERFNYVSTCYVSGQRTGTILERELDHQTGFKNHYEETKFWAEVEVQRRSAHLPTTIFRPGIVIGDSRTGQTDKYDGPYYLFKLLQRLPQAMPLPQLGQGQAVVNLVPIDFVRQALATLGTTPTTVGQVFHLADPDPMRARDIMALTLRLLGRRSPVGSLPAPLVERALRISALQEQLGLPRQTLQYFNHDARYDSTNTQRALAPTRHVRCPHLSSYLDRILAYMVEHPDKPFLDGRSR